MDFIEVFFLIVAVLIRIIPFIVTAMAEYTARRERKINGFNTRNLHGENSNQRSKYESFRVGKFQGTLRRRLMMATKKSGRIDLRNDEGALQMMTFFSITIPAVQSFYFTLEFPESQWDPRARPQQALFRDLVWDIPERELDEAFHRLESIQLLRDLFSLGPGSIVCADNDFSIYIKRGLRSEAELESFYSTARKIFRVYARVAQLNLLEWRSPENNYDWWRGVSR